MLTLDNLLNLIIKELDISYDIIYPVLKSKTLIDEKAIWHRGKKINDYFILIDYYFDRIILSVNFRILESKESIIKERVQNLLTKINAIEPSCILSNNENLVEIVIDNVVVFYYSDKVNESIISIVINSDFKMNDVLYE